MSKVLKLVAALIVLLLSCEAGYSQNKLPEVTQKDGKQFTLFSGNQTLELSKLIVEGDRNTELYREARETARKQGMVIETQQRIIEDQQLELETFDQLYKSDQRVMEQLSNNLILCTQQLKRSEKKIKRNTIIGSAVAAVLLGLLIAK